MQICVQNTSYVIGCVVDEETFVNLTVIWLVSWGGGLPAVPPVGSATSPMAGQPDSLTMVWHH